jgi:hypothetical protein
MPGVDCGKLDLTKLPLDELITIGNQTWLSADVDEKIYIIDDKPHVVIKLSNACLATVCDDQNDLNPALLQQAGVSAANQESEPSEGGSSQSQTRSVPSEINNSNEELTQAQSAVDLNSINVLSSYGAAVKPASAIIPMKSNIKAYGPYASSNFSSSYGGTQVETNSELCPWIFGSIEAMNAAGASMVESAAIGLIKTETGSVTIPGLPLSNLNLLGLALNSSGPTLSSLNFSYGSNGITTRYEFRTYTPKFGSLNRHAIDKLKSIAKNRIEQLRFLRTNQTTLNKISRKLRKVENPPRDNDKPKGTLQRVLIGEMYDWSKVSENKYTQCSIVGLDSLRKSVGEMVYDYEKKAYISLDALYGPISKAGDGGLPRYAQFEASQDGDINKNKSSYDLPQPPFAIQAESESTEDPFVSGLDQYNLSINQKYLDPLNNAFETEEHHHDGAGTGHVIDLVGREQEIPESGLITNFYNPDDENRYSDDYRFLGMRGPILLHSWGYDTQGKPIPNSADTEEDTKSGTFTKEYLKDQFLKDWLGKPATWPVAPIDFRFDRKRGVWVCPPGYKVVVAKLDETLDSYQTAKATLINRDEENQKDYGDELFDKDGERVETDTAKIRVVDRIGQSYEQGSKLYCYYDPYNSEYIVLSGKPKDVAIRFKLIDPCSSPPEPNYESDNSWGKYAGYGDKFLDGHILGVRINCNGNPINASGVIIGSSEIDGAISALQGSDDEESIALKKSVFVNLLDSCGKHGPAYAHYGDFNQWKERAHTGFAISCPPAISGTEIQSCGLGKDGNQCAELDGELDTYDILFLDTYARFVECELTQKLYANPDTASEDYSDDSYKSENPEGNAAATIKNFYGDSPNGKEPKFYDSSLEELDFRVFDPFKDVDKLSNPFSKLDAGDTVLAVFDENRKQYLIYNSVQTNESIIKFALVDNKDIGDRTSQAVLVDSQGYPVDVNGERLTEDNFTENFITVTDCFAIHGYGDTSYDNSGTTGFGPALGGESFSEHIEGITLSDGSSQEETTGGPFIGFAISKKEKQPSESESESEPENTINQIFWLETFAKFIEGKIVSKSPVVESNYYLGIRRSESYINGRPPITRDGIDEDNKANLRVRVPIDQFAAGKYVLGDWCEEQDNSDPYNNADGCKFLAVLDHVNSTVNKGSEKLYYNILETEHLATRVRSVILDQEMADELNMQGKIKHEVTDGEPKIVSEFLDGFIWDQTKSKKNYEQIIIFNRLDWVKKALLFKWDNAETLHIHSDLVGFDASDPQNGGPAYRISHAGTIARVLETITPEQLAGKLGQLGGVQDKDLKIGKFTASAGRTAMYHGLPPTTITDEEDQPSLSLGSYQSWMTYNDSTILALWNENIGDGSIKKGMYNIVYAREAPVIITGKAYSDFRPEAEYANVTITSQDAYASCPGVDEEPVISLTEKAKNPLGYGALEGDLVTLQRVHLKSLSSEHNNQANYYYMVIGTGKTPN